MIIDLPSLPAGGATFSGEEPEEVFQHAGRTDLVWIKGPVRYRLRAELTGRELLVKGRLDGAIAFRCARCGEAADRAASEEDFERVVEVDEAARAVDLTSEIREAMLLAFPNYPVCRPDCKGVCPHCGRNLNQGPCGCGPEADARWSALTQWAGQAGEEPAEDRR